MANLAAINPTPFSRGGFAQDAAPNRSCVALDRKQAEGWLRCPRKLSCGAVALRDIKIVVAKHFNSRVPWLVPRT